LVPFLKIGVTFAFFHPSGTSPVSRDLLKITVSRFISELENCWRSDGLIPSGLGPPLSSISGFSSPHLSPAPPLGSFSFVHCWTVYFCIWVGGYPGSAYQKVSNLNPCRIRLRDYKTTERCGQFRKGSHRLFQNQCLCNPLNSTSSKGFSNSIEVLSERSGEIRC
jgi:hypothetical protein